MFTALFLLWIAFNGRLTLEIVLLGLLICAALTFFWQKVFGIHRYTIVPPLRKVWGGIAYLATLLREMVISNIHVMWLILHPRREVKPQLLLFRTNVKHESGRTVLANSITLTPGTITISADDDRFCVHALDESLSKELLHGALAHRLEKMEEK